MPKADVLHTQHFLAYNHSTEAQRPETFSSNWAQPEGAPAARSSSAPAASGSQYVTLAKLNTMHKNFMQVLYITA